MEENFLKRNRVLVTIFLTISIIFFIIAAFCYRGLFSYIPACFLVCFLAISSGDFSPVLSSLSPNSNYCITLFNLPYNMLESFFAHTSLIQSGLYTFCSHLSVLLIVTFNFILAKRTKRFDIAVIALCFYSFLFLPASVCFASEINFEIFVLLTFFQYFLSKEKLWKQDYFIIAVLGLCLLQSNAAMMIPLALIFIISVFYAFSQKKYIKNKIIIGMISFISMINLLIKGDISSFNQDLLLNISLIPNIFKTCMILSFAGIVLILYSLCIKRYFNKKDSLFFIVICSLNVCILGHYTHFIPSPFEESTFIFLELLLVYPTILIVAVMDFLKIENKDFNNNNILVIACIIGILHMCWQINSCRYSYSYGKELFEKITESESIYTFVSKDNLSEFAAQYYLPSHNLLRGLILSPQKEIKTLLLPENTEFDNDIPIIEDTYFSEYEDHNELSLQGVVVNENNKYWCFDKVADIIKSQQK